MALVDERPVVADEPAEPEARGSQRGFLAWFTAEGGKRPPKTLA
jgi:hypothetical protein